MIRLYGADNPDALRGPYLDGVVLDEFADMKPEVWHEVVRPMLADRRGWATFIGTPKGKNEFLRLYQNALKDEAWFHMILKASESGIIAPSELADLRRERGEDQYQQEFECSFEAAIKGAFYAEEMRTMLAEGRMRRLLLQYPEVSPAEFKAAVREQWAILAVDERAAIKALPQLLPADAPARRSFSDLVQAMAATAKLKADGQRRLTEVLHLVAAGTS